MQADLNLITGSISYKLCYLSLFHASMLPIKWDKNTYLKNIVLKQKGNEIGEAPGRKSSI